VQPDDVLIALASDGLHTNGYSLARRIISDRLKLSPHDPFPMLMVRALPTSCSRCNGPYLSCLRPVLGHIHAMAHITGGGLPGNLNRALPETLDANVITSTWTIPLGSGYWRTPARCRASRCTGPSTWVSEWSLSPRGTMHVTCWSRPTKMTSLRGELGGLVPGTGKVRIDGVVT
jgi:hypothetical protein